MHILFEIISAVIENLVFDVLAYLPKKFYRALMILFYGQTFDREPKRIHWAPRYALGILAVLLAVVILGGVVMLAYFAIVAI